MHLARPLLLATILASSVLAADLTPEERERLKAVAEVVRARRVVLDHDSGKKPATEAELAAALEILRKHKHDRPKQIPPEPPHRGPSLKLPDADLETTATACRVVFGLPRVVLYHGLEKRRIVDIRINAATQEELREKFTAELRRHGLHLIDHPDGGKILAPVPNSSPSPPR